MLHNSNKFSVYLRLFTGFIPLLTFQWKWFGVDLSGDSCFPFTVLIWLLMPAQNYQEYSMTQWLWVSQEQHNSAEKYSLLCVSHFFLVWLTAPFSRNCFQIQPWEMWTGNWEGWVYSQDFGAIACQAKGCALCCTISQCLSALSQNNWCQAYVVYMPVLGHGCQCSEGEAGQ